MRNLKGQENTAIKPLIGLAIALAIAGIFVILFFPLITGSEDAASCVGLLRHVASVVANAFGQEIC